MKSKLNIVVLDGYTLNPGDLSWDMLTAIGDLIVYDRIVFATEPIVQAIGNAEIVFTNKTPLTAAVLEKAPSVKYIGVLATGYNVVDIDAAKKMGITVTNVPAYSTDSVAQLTFALLLEICHHVGSHNDSVKNGQWSGNSDIISLHCPLTDKTKNIISRDSITRMKEGVMIINTARGPLINEADLCGALESGKVAAAAVDVVSVEPVSVNNPLLNAKNIIITPHIAWAPKAARTRLMNTAISNLKAFLNGKPENVVGK